MFKRLNFFCVCLLFVNLVFSQEKIKEVPSTLYPKSFTFHVLSEDQKEVCIFFDEHSNNGDPNDDYIKAIRFNENLDPMDSLDAPRPAFDQTQRLVGYSKKGDVYFTYWHDDSNQNTFTYQSYDFAKREVDQGTITISTTKGDIIKKTAINNSFYVITLEKKSNVLNFFKINGKENTKHTVDFTKHSFLADGLTDKAVSFNEIMYNRTLQEISDESPSSIVNSSFGNKFYKISQNELLFTFDNNDTVTQGFTINLENYETKIIKIRKPNLQEEDNVNSNSFYFKNHFVQIKNNSKEFLMSFKNFNGDEIKSYSILRDKEIEFKNSEIMQENGSYKSARVLEKTNQFLRKINGLTPSISCYDNGGFFNVIIGGVGDYQTKSPMVYSGMGAVGGFMVAAYISSLTNYAMANINSYENRKIVYVNCVFDKDFKTVSREAQKLAFDKVREFMEEEKLSLYTVFKMKENLILGGYNKKTKKYSFYRFTN